MIKQAIASLAQLFFPHICYGCGTDIIQNDQVICLRCGAELPLTNFHAYENNSLEKIFRGRLPIMKASSLCYFSKSSMIQHLMHQLKYNGNREVGLYMGRQMGAMLHRSGRFNDIDLLVPLPLFAAREKKRGYNQAAILCGGMQEIMQIPMAPKALTRLTATETQTHKSRLERWQNMQDRFAVQDEAALANKHILLVDDVVTTGATLEACGNQILSVAGTTLSIATLAYTML